MLFNCYREISKLLNQIYQKSFPFFALLFLSFLLPETGHTYDLLLSSSADRSNSVLLESETVSSDIYVFVSSEMDISKVSFFLDDPDMSGAPYQVDDEAPFDFAGTEQGFVGEVNGVVSIEAEHYFSNISQGGHDWVEVFPNGYSGSGAMEASPNNGTNNNTGYTTNSPRLDFSVDFAQSGIYYVWIRGIGATLGDDSVHVGLNGNAVSTSDRISGFGTDWTWSNETMDGPVATIDIPSAGVHTVNVWMREDGFVLDKVVLTTDSNCPVCTGIGPDEGNAKPYDTTQLFDGSHEITASIDLSGSGTEVINSTFTVDNTVAYDLLLSSSADRSSPVLLESETVSSDIYVFVSSEMDISKVSFFLDDPDMSGAPYQVDDEAPFDFAGTEQGFVGEVNGVVSIEAEHYFSNISQGGHDWVEVFPNGYSGSGAMEASPNNGTNNNTGYTTNSPRLDFSVDFAQSGIYYVWIRGIGATLGDDSVHVGLNGNAVSTSDRISGFGTDWTWSNETMDGPVATIDIPSAGVHTVNVWMREDGFVLDKVVLTTDSNCPVCTGIGPDEGNAKPYDTTQLFDGSHEITASIDLSGSGTEVINSTFTVDNTVAYDLLLSSSADRSSPVLLESETVSSDIYVFVSSEMDISKVSFFLDDPDMSGAPYQVDDEAPFDFAGTEQGFVGEVNGVVSIEAEHYFSNISQGGHDWVEVFPNGYSGSGAMEASPNNGTNNNTGYTTNSPRLDFSVDFAQSGIYYVWIRGIGATLGDDSVHVGLNGNAVSTSDRISGFGTDWTWSNETMDGPVATIDIPSAGVHTVNVWMREDGFVLDKVVLTTDSNCPVCTGIGPDEGNAKPYDTTQLSDGSHEITASIDLSGSGTEVINSTFTVDNNIELPIVEDFNDGDADDWTVIDDSGHASDWQVIDSEYHQKNPFTISTFVESYHIGKYSFLDSEFGLTDYRVSVEVTPLDERGNDVGLMFRYQDNDNYYRLSLNSRYGFARLEKSVNGLFSPLRTNSRGYITGQRLDIVVEVRGSLILVFLDNDPLFSIFDSSISSGTIALYCQGAAKFDTILIEANSSEPAVVISSPVAYSVAATEQGVVHEVNGVVSIEGEHYFSNISQGGHDWVEVFPNGYSGSGAMEASPNNGTNNNTGYTTNSPRLDFSVDFAQSGIYYVWIRGIGATLGDDSVHVGLNGNAVSTSDRISGFGTDWTWSNETMDGPVATIDIPSAGVHTVNVWMREDGFVLDKVVLTTDSNCPVCTGIGPDENPVDTLSVFAVATNVPFEGWVEFELDGLACEPSSENPEGVFASRCLDLSQGESTLHAILRNSGSSLDTDTNEKIGVFGDYFFAVGDSITNGGNDNFKSDNISENGRVISFQGFESNLTDLLSNTLNYPVIVFNEGIPGDESYNAAYERVDSILQRHPNSNNVLVLLGINDSAGSSPVPSGWGCSGAACAGTYKENIQLLIDKILAYGKQPVVALVTPAFGATNSGEPFLDPLSADRNILLQEYNWVIAGDGVDPPMLTGHHVGPDFFSYFLGSGVNRFSLFGDNVHPNALGMIVIAHLWHNSLTGGNVFPFTIEDLIPSNYKQNLLEEGDHYYIDRDYKLESIPSELTGNDIAWIMTADDDKDNTSDDFISFYIDQDTNLYVAYDPRATSPPNWLVNNFTSTGLVLGVTDPQTTTLDLYSSDFPAGTVSLGGNKAAGASYPDGVDAANYVVVIKKY